MRFPGTHQSSRSGRFPRGLPAVAGVAALLSLVLAVPAAFAGNQGSFPQAFNQETTPGFTNTFTPPTSALNPQCPNALAGTPGSDPANKVINMSPSVTNNFAPGGIVHYIYTDNPHGSAFGFDIQDCEVVYPASFFSASDFDPSTGVLINPAFSKSVLDANGTEVDGAELSGISNPEGQIYFTWSVPESAPLGSWICNFARDIDTDHGGMGNRKVTPTCFQVSNPTPEPAVFAGYADSFRPVALSTPSLWACDGTCPAGVTDVNGNGQTVTFVGCAIPGVSMPCGDIGFDAGAIRIDDPSTTEPMTVSAATVTIASSIFTCTYSPWLSTGGPPLGFPATTPAGGTVILTETGLGATGIGSPCGDISETPNDNFDTSEANDKTNPVDQCTPDTTPVIPQISLTVSVGGSTPTTFNFLDNSQVLNKGGIDPGDCPLGGPFTNETQDWTAVTPNP